MSVPRFWLRGLVRNAWENRSEARLPSIHDNGPPGHAHRLTGPVWRPLVEWSRRRHLHFRRRLEARTAPTMACAVVSAGV